MYCSNCGTNLPTDANFCPACGTAAQRPTVDQAQTTAAISLPEGEDHDLGEVPELAPGTGMLVVVRGPSAGARFLLDREVVTIGRNPDADLFLDDVTVSRNHAEILRTERGLVLEDRSSMNGTYVGADRVESHLLSTGDEVQVGRFKMVYVGPESVGPEGV